MIEEAVGLGYDALSERGVKEALLASADSGSQLTAAQAMVYAAENNYAALSDAQLSEALLAVIS